MPNPNSNWEVVLDAIAEVINGDLGAVRTITAGSYGNLAYGARDAKASTIEAKIVTTRALAMPRIIRVGNAAAMPQRPGNIAMKRASIVIRVEREFRSEQRLDAAEMLALNGAAADDEDALIQALTWPNLTTKADLTATNLVSGRLRQESPSDIGDYETIEGDKVGRIVSRHRFFAEITYATAIS